MVRPYYNRERGKQKKDCRDHPDKPISAEQDQKTISEEHKEHANVRYQKLSQVNFSPRVISPFFFFFSPPNTMDLPVGFPGRQSEPALQQHCSLRSHAYAAQAIHYTLPLQKDIDLQCSAASKAYRTGAKAASGDCTGGKTFNQRDALYPAQFNF